MGQAGRQNDAGGRPGVRMRPVRGRRRVLVAGCAAVGLALTAAACTDESATPSGTAAPATSTTPSATTSADPSPSPTRPPEVPLVEVAGISEAVTGLAAPWGLDLVTDPEPGGVFAVVTLRDAATVLLVAPGRVTPLTGAGAEELAASTVAEGEGGLLGVALAPGYPEDPAVFLYRTTADGNEVVRAEVSGDALGPLTVVLDGIPAAPTHNGGQLAFGPDGMLYVGTGDAGEPRDAQDPDSLAGAILRLGPDGSVPADNPVANSPVWSLGHRNVQGLGWSQDGRLFASEFGADAADEVNAIRPGGNYGWPVVEGPGGTAAGFDDPVVSWTPDQASPSGLAVTEEGVYVAALRGERLWRIPLGQGAVGEPQALLTGEWGRLRAVRAAPDGTLWVLTGATDGRGQPREGDDRLLRIEVRPVG